MEGNDIHDTAANALQKHSVTLVGQLVVAGIEHVNSPDELWAEGLQQFKHQIHEALRIVVKQLVQNPLYVFQKKHVRPFGTYVI